MNDKIKLIKARPYGKLSLTLPFPQAEDRACILALYNNTEKGIANCGIVFFYAVHLTSDPIEMILEWALPTLRENH